LSASARRFTSIAKGAPLSANQPSSARSSTAPRLSLFETNAKRRPRARIAASVPEVTSAV